MVKPSVKRTVIKYLKAHYKAGVKRMTDLLGLSRSSYYYQIKLDDTEVIEKLNELISIQPNRELITIIAGADEKAVAGQEIRCYKSIENEA